MLDQKFSEVKKLLSLNHLDFQLKEDWGSKKQGYRKLIHDKIKKIGVYAPRFTISHTFQIGGFAWSDDIDVLIGLDIEQTTRVRSELAERISSTAEEFLKAPQSASLWCAKEACFKALRGPNQPQVVTEIIMKDWQILPNGYELVSSNFGGLGCVFHLNEHTFCIYKIIL
jgi:4'-phosphopantetheinyl transferase